LAALWLGLFWLPASEEVILVRLFWILLVENTYEFWCRDLFILKFGLYENVNFCLLRFLNFPYKRCLSLSRTQTFKIFGPLYRFQHIIAKKFIHLTDF
jgi:hypothetical protein